MVEPIENSTSLDADKLPLEDESLDGAGNKVVEGAEKQAVDVEAPKPRTFSQEEWDKRQSALDKQISQAREERERSTSTLQAALEEATKQLEETKYRNFLASVEAAGGDVNAANGLVAQQKELAAERRKLEAEKRANEQQIAVLSAAGKGKYALDLIKQYELGEDSSEKLLVAKSEVEMENIALKLHVEQVKSKARPAGKVDSGKQTAPSRDLSKMPPAVVLGTLMDEASK